MFPQYVVEFKILEHSPFYDFQIIRKIEKPRNPDKPGFPLRSNKLQGMRSLLRFRSADSHFSTSEDIMLFHTNKIEY
jgi:hypothetical protein